MRGDKNLPGAAGREIPAPSVCGALDSQPLAAPWGD